MQNTNMSVIGISLGTRAIGFAVRKGNELLEWKVQTLRGEWSVIKLRRILDLLRESINIWKPDELVLKDIRAIKGSPGLHQLHEHVLDMLITLNIPYRWIIFMKGCNTRNVQKEVVETVIQRFPQLSYLYMASNNGRSKYYKRIFEAIFLTLS